MDLIPVIDLMGGQVIRGRAGVREEYQPNVSRLLHSSNPQATCQALIRAFRTHSMYVADLDGILHRHPHLEVLRELAKCNVELSVDAGSTTVDEAIELIRVGVKRVVIGLEVLPRLEDLKRFVAELGPENVIFSLDLMNGDPIGPDATGRNAIEVVASAMECGIRNVIVLDLAYVGTNRGVSTMPLCHSMKKRWPDLVIWTGGGVRSLADLHQLFLNRVDGAMVASALHDGHISPADWRSFRTLSNDSTQLAMDA